MKIDGEITKILTKKDDDWGRYSVKGKHGTLLCVGILPNAVSGMKVVLEGHEEDTKWGHQFRIAKVISSSADEYAGIRSFLGDGYVKGIGPAKAKAIVKKLGEKSVSSFFTASGRKKLREIRGITDAIMEKALPSLQENIQYLPIVNYLNGAVTKNQAALIYKKYGDGAVQTLAGNPYILVYEVDGFGFLKADALAEAAGISPDSEIRIKAAISYVIDNACLVEGHCFLYKDDLLKRTLDFLTPVGSFDDVGDKAVENFFNNAVTEGAEAARAKFVKAHKPSEATLQKINEVLETRIFVTKNFENFIKDSANEGYLILEDDGAVYTKRMYETEKRTAEFLKSFASAEPLRRVSKTTIDKAIKNAVKRKKEDGINFVITDEQMNAVKKSLDNRISVITGGPGRGKTAIAEIVADAFIKSERGSTKKDILMLAPTGRAAQRLNESTGYEAQTIHRAAYKAEMNNDYPENKLIIVDESSMVDINLMLRTLKFAKNCQLLFMGDVNQIASVGPGKVLADMINSGKIPVSRLTKGHRNMGSIAVNAAYINAGKKLKDYEYDDAFVYTPCATSDIMDNIVHDYLAKINEYGIEEVMLISAMRERGPVAVAKLNNTLQNILTRGHEEFFSGGRTFRTGDRVMQTKNDYNLTLTDGSNSRDGVMNGERGTVTKIRHDRDETYLVIRFDDGFFGEYSQETAKELTLAYATTVHKCQGSEAKCVMMAYTYSDYMLLNRSLFYTGETRAKKEFRMYGEVQERYGKVLSAFDIAAGRINDRKRNTKLAERIKEA